MLKINFSKVLTIDHFVQLAVKVLHKSANIYYREIKLYRKTGTIVSSLTLRS